VRSKLGIVIAALLLLVSTETLWARVVRVEVTSRQDVLGGRSFGDVGPYERILGTVCISLAVDDPRNAAIVDLKNAVNLHDGQVEFAADFMAIRPKDPRRGNGSLLLERTPIGAAAASFRWWMAAIGIWNMMREMRGCSAGASPLSALAGSGMQREKTLFTFRLQSQRIMEERSLGFYAET
jgi:hypothetical protein